MVVAREAGAPTPWSVRQGAEPGNPLQARGQIPASSWEGRWQPGTASALERPELQRGCVRSCGVTYSSAGLCPLALCLFFKFIASSFLIS